MRGSVELNLIHIAGLVVPVQYPDKSWILVDNDFWLCDQDLLNPIPQQGPLRLRGTPLVILNVRDNFERTPQHIADYIKLLQKHKALGVIACELPIPAQLAANFTGLFYANLFQTHEGIGQALRNTKAILLQAGNPFAMFYAPFFNPTLHTEASAHPAAVVSSPKPSESAVLTWLHLSDFHIGRKEKSRDWESLERALLDDIKAHLQPIQPRNCAGTMLRPDLILITGDVAHKAAPREYKLAEEFIRQVWQILGFDEKTGRERTFIVPGNHDTDRAAVVSEMVFTSAYQQLANNELTAEEWLDSVFAWWENGSLRTLWKKKLASFKNFAGRCATMPTERGYFTKTMDLVGVKLNVIGLNSAHMSWKDKEDLEHGLWIGKPQLDELEKTLANDADLRLVLVHHPQEALHYRDGAWDRVTHLADVVFHGHMHDTKTIPSNEPGREHLRIAGGAANEKGTWHSQRYSYGRFNATTRDLHLYLRMTKPGGWPEYIQDNLTYTEFPDGHLKFTLPKKR